MSRLHLCYCYSFFPTSGPMPKYTMLRGNCPIRMFYLVFVCSSQTAYRLEDTFGPDPTMMRANCLVQTTEWSACSKTCGMGISTRVTNDNTFCRLEKQSRLCMVRPCEADLEENIKVNKYSAPRHSFSQNDREENQSWLSHRPSYYRPVVSRNI